MHEIKWSGENNHVFNFNILNYEFPEKGASDGYDAEWLRLGVDASNSLGTWSKSAPCLLTWELVWLRRWLDYVVDGSIEHNELAFLEPELKFIFLAETQSWYHFSVVLNYSLARSIEHQPNVLHLQLSERDHSSTLEAMDKAIELFPSRTSMGKGNEGLGPKIL
jgi:hypothetical protein